MSGFKKREQGFEAKFALDEAKKFKAVARRNKLLGLWAAGLMGLTGEAADAYAGDIVKADLAEPGEEDVFRKLRHDFDAKKISVSDHLIRKHMQDLLAEAAEQVKKED